MAISPLPAKHPQGWLGKQAGVRHLLGTGRALKASWGSCDDVGLQTKQTWDDPAASGAPFGAAARRLIELDHPCHTVKDTSDGVGLQASWKPFGTGRLKNKQGFWFQKFYF